MFKINRHINNRKQIVSEIKEINYDGLKLGGLFSMNVDGIPMHLLPNAFWIVFGMILIPTALIVIFMLANRKRWF